MDKQTRCFMRQAAYIEALLSDKPLTPEGSRWTVGDLVGLAATLATLLDNVPADYRDSLGMPLGEILN